MKTQEKEHSVFARRLRQLREERGWSQPQLAKMIGTSGTIVGRYERDFMTPSIEVARKLAEVFQVSLDYLLTEQDTPAILKDQDMLARLRNLDRLSPNDKERILFVIDSLIREANTREAYKAN